MARKKMAVGGVQSILNRRRNYWFDENDGIVEFDNSPEPTSSNESDVSNTQKDSTSEKSNSIVTIGTKTFGTAFKQARVAGLDKFRWNGKVYNTKLSSEVKNSNVKNKPTSRKTNSQKSTRRNKTSKSNKRLNNPKDAVNVPYSRRNGRIEGQLPTATVTAQSRPRPRVPLSSINVDYSNSPYSARNLASTPINRQAVNNYNRSVGSRVSAFNRMADNNAAIGSRRWVDVNSRKRRNK